MYARAKRAPDETKTNGTRVIRYIRDTRDTLDECPKRVGRPRRPQGRKQADHLCPSKANAAAMGTRGRWVGTAKRMRADEGAVEAT